MSKIIAKDNFKTENWEVVFNDLKPMFADLYIGFTDDAPIIHFRDLKFKYELLQDGNITQYGVFPKPNTKFVRSNEEFLVIERLNFKPKTTYDLYLWAENNKQSFETTVQFTSPAIVK